MHRYIKFLLIGFAAVFTISFGSAVYLRTRQIARVDNPIALESPHTLADLLAAGRTHLANGQVEQALIAFRKALVVEPASIEAQMGVAQGEFAAGREDLAAREFESVLRLDARNGAAMLAAANIYSQNRRTWPQSESRFKEYLNQNPNDDAADLQFGRVLAWQGKSTAAAGVFSKESVQARMSHQDWRLFAFALADSKQTAEAERRIRQILTRDPNDREMRVQLANIYASQRRWDEAAPLYRAFLGERPNDPKLNLDYGLMLVAMKDYRAALGPLEKAKTMIPESGEARVAYARALKGVGDSRNASREFERVLPLYPDSASIVREYADLLLERRDYRKSATYYKRAYSMGLDDQRLLMGLAGALSGDQKYKEALIYMEQAHERAPSERTTFELAKLLQRVGDRERALRLLDTIDKRQAARRE